MSTQRPAENYPRPGKILFIGEAVSLAHVGRPALLAHWARALGYQVAFACGAKFAAIARDQGLVPLDLETISPDNFYTRLRAGSFPYSQSELERYVERERELIRDEQPDLVVGDFRLTLAISARLEGVPLLTLQQAHWSPASKARFPAPAAGALGCLPRAVRGRLFNVLRPIAYRFFAAPLDDLRQRYGLPKHRDFRRNYTDGDYCAYLDLPELAALEHLPSGHFILGPLFWTPTSPAEKSDHVRSQKVRSSRKSDRPLAYVSMGSSGDGRVLPEVLRVLLEAGYQTVLSGNVQNQDIADTPQVCHVGTVNPAEILSRATLTVCHGGSGTVYQSLAAGVPVLCLPSNPDQELMARATAFSGAGSCLPAESVSEEKLRLQVLRSGSESCCKAAKHLARVIDTYDTCAHWQAWLQANVPLQQRDDSVSARRDHSNVICDGKRLVGVSLGGV